jgi:glutamate transport system permease protein
VEYLVTALPQILGAFLTTLELTVGAFALALVLGTAAATMRILPAPVLRALGTLYVEVVRNVPLLVILILLVFGFPEAGMTFPLFACMVLGMGVYAGTYVCEVVRSGILSVSRGEVEAARALGLSIPQIMRLIVLPIAFGNMVQPLANVLISTILSTSLAGSLGVLELTGIASRLQDQSAQLLLTFGILGIGYVVITLTAGLSAGRLQRFLDRRFTVDNKQRTA